MTVALAPITSVVATYGTDVVADLADVYARMTDELAATFTGHTLAEQIMREALGALHVALDELTENEAPAEELVRLAVDARELAAFAADQDDPTFTVARPMLLELHDALVDAIDQQVREG